MTREYENAIGEFRDTDEVNLWTEVVVKCVRDAHDPAGAIEYADDIVRAHRERMGVDAMLAERAKGGGK